MDYKKITLNNGETIGVRYAIDLIDFGVIVNLVTDYCFDEDTGEYHPEFLDAITYIYIVGYYTDMDTAEKDTSELYRDIVEKDIIEAIMPHVSRAQICDLKNAIKRAVDFKVNTMTSTASGQVIKAMGEIDRLAGSMKNVAPEDMRKMLDYIGNGGKPDETKIVEALTAAKKRTRKKKTDNGG